METKVVGIIFPEIAAMSDEPGDLYALGIDVGTTSVKIAVVRRSEASVQIAFHTEKNTDASYFYGVDLIMELSSVLNNRQVFHSTLRYPSIIPRATSKTRA